MKTIYKNYENPTKEILDTLEIGDTVKCNKWREPYKVVAISDNYFIMTRPIKGKTYVSYSICYKNKAGFTRMHSENCGILPDLPYIGPDFSLFGRFHYIDDCEDALKQLESGELEISERRGVSLNNIWIKRGK